MFKDIKVEEIMVYLMLIVVGYYIAKMFSRSCNGFSVGGQRMCADAPPLTCISGTNHKANPSTITMGRIDNFQTACCE